MEEITKKQILLTYNINPHTNTRPNWALADLHSLKIKMQVIFINYNKTWIFLDRALLQLGQRLVYDIQSLKFFTKF